MDPGSPQDWASYIGQPNLKSRLSVYMSAARKDGRPLEHILLTGPPGVGKTTLAGLIALEMGDDIVSTIAPVKATWLTYTLHRLYGVLFIDEIHRFSKKAQEELLPLVDAEPTFHLANGSKLKLSHLTIIGATTMPEGLIPPLYDRFPIKPMFEPYTLDDMTKMVEMKTKFAGLDLDEKTISVMASASCGIPRNAVGLVTAAKSLKTSTGANPDGEAILTLCGLTDEGLNEHHLLYLQTLRDFGGKVGLNTLSTILRLHPKVLNDLERVLVENQYVMYTSTGRELLTKGYNTLKKGTIQ